jgi:hypothetical protein
MPTVLTEQAPVPPPAYHRASTAGTRSAHRCADVSAHAAPAHIVPRGDAARPSSMCAAFTRRARRRATHLWRGVLAGKFPQGWADFELEGGKLMRRVGIGVQPPPHPAPHLVSFHADL